MNLSTKDIIEIETAVCDCLGIDKKHIDIQQEDYNHTMSIWISNTNEQINIAQFNLTEMPGCCGIIISYGTYICPAYRNKGLGKKLAVLKQRLAKEWGYTVMICTDIAENKPQRKILDHNNWETVASFKNRRTANPINIDVKHLYGESVLKNIKHSASKLSYPFKYMMSILKKTAKKCIG